MLNLRTAAVAACLALSSLPAAADYVWIGESTGATGPLGQYWTGAWSEGWNIAEYFSDVSIDADTLSYDYLAGGSWAGTPTQTYVFSTAAASAGRLNLNIELRSNGQWEGSATSMYLWQGNTDNRQLLAGATGNAAVSKQLSLDLSLGEAWGFLAVGGSIGDNLGYTGPVYGSFKVTDAADGSDIPEPASLVLLGLGALGFAARRKARQTLPRRR